MVVSNNNTLSPTYNDASTPQRNERSARLKPAAWVAGTWLLSLVSGSAAASLAVPTRLAPRLDESRRMGRQLSQIVVAPPASSRPSPTGPLAPPAPVKTPPPTPVPPGAQIPPLNLNNTSLTGAVSALQGDNGQVLYQTTTINAFTSVRTTMIAPAQPPAHGTLFLWPGLQPMSGGAKFDPIGLGVLQTVLSWGPSAVVDQAPDDATYGTWYVGAMYVNPNSTVLVQRGIQGSPTMPVAVGDTLTMSISLNGTTWSQEVINENTQQRVTFSNDLAGQAQLQLYFAVEKLDAAPIDDVLFLNSTFTMAQPDFNTCRSPLMMGQRDFAALATSTRDGTGCFIPRIVLRGQDGPATQPN